MNTLERRIALVAGPLAVGLWIAGLIVENAVPSKIPHHPTDAQLLTWVQGNKNAITLGAFLFMVGCAVFLWFASILRTRLASAEGENHTFSTLVFGAAAVMCALGVGMNPDIVTALNASSVSAATAGTVHNLGDLFFIGAEVALFPLLVGAAVVAYRTAVLPKWWASVGALVGVVALIGPIGWAALIFGFPVWLLGTTAFLSRTPRRVVRSGRRDVAEPVPQVL
jgi:MFS family permease